MKGQKTLFSSKSDEWRTPPSLLQKIKNDGYHIIFDLAAHEENAVCDNYNTDLTPEYLANISSNILVGMKLVTYCNPPYSQCKKFVWMIAQSNVPCIMLLPARTCTTWFHDHIYLKPNVRIEFLRGRLKFSGNKNSAPFPSMLVYFRC